MQKFFELEELDPADREWTNRCGNGKGAGAVSISGTYLWTPPDDDEDDEEQTKGSKKSAKGDATADGPKSKSAAVGAGDAGGSGQVALGESGGGSGVLRQGEGGGGRSCGWRDNFHWRAGLIGA